MNGNLDWNEVRDPSMRSELGDNELMVVGTPMKLNVAVVGSYGTDEYPLQYQEEAQ